MTSANFRGNAKKTPLNSNAIENILSRLPQINACWILTGEGEMLNNHITQTNQNGDNINGHNVTVNKTEVVQLIELLKKKDEQIDRLLTLLEKK